MADVALDHSDRITAADSTRQHSVWLGWLTILFVFGGLVAWSFLAPFEGAVLTTGQVEVESNQQAVQHLEGGIVEHIYVQEADQVQEGQKLLTLSSTISDARIQALEARLFDLLGTEARLVAERDDTDDLVIRPGFEDLLESRKMLAVLETQKALLSARKNTRQTRLSIVDQKVDQLRTRIDGMTQEIQSKDSQIYLLKDEVSRFEHLSANGNASEIRVLALKRELSRVEGEKEALRSEIAVTKVQIGEAQSEFLRLQQDTQESILSELREVQTQIEELTEQRTAALDHKNRLNIIAPRTGRVIGIRAHTVGGVITASEPIMYIVPDDEHLVAKVKINLTDRDKVSVGQEAVLRFTAFNQDETPQYSGEIIKISADALSEPSTGIAYYEAMISIPDSALLSSSFPIVPGMPVDASLQTESRSVISYLIKPLQDSVTRTFRE